MHNTSEYLLMLLIQLGADGLTTSRGTTESPVSASDDSPEKELQADSDISLGGRNCQRKSRSTAG